MYFCAVPHLMIFLFSETNDHYTEQQRADFNKNKSFLSHFMKHISHGTIAQSIKD